jgi:oligopeptide transport system substrate-binding protein
MKTPALVVVLLALLTLAGCAKRETPAEAGIRTHTLLVGSGSEPGSLDPHLVNRYEEQRVLMALFEGLTVIDERTVRPVPAVAESWDISPDGLVYTFHLRANSRWSNGDPVTAHDFAYSFQRILLPRLGARNAYRLWPIKNAEAFNGGKLTDFSVVGVEALDDRTLRLTLERPTPYLLTLAAHNSWLPVHRASIEQSGAIEDRTSPWTRPGRLVGNGAFTLTEWRPNDRIIVTKNPCYWDAAHNRLERVVFFPTENPEVDEHNFRAGQVHVTNSLPTTKIAGYRTRDPARFHSDPLLSSFYLSFNVTKPPLDNPKVRRALSLAIDREGLMRAVFAGSRLPAPCLMPSGCGDYTARARVPTDFAAARRLLTEAGFPGGNGLPEMPILLGTGFSEWSKIVEAIQETWRRELGVRVTLTPLELKTRFQNEQTGNYVIVFGAWIADFADPANFLEVFLKNGGNNTTRWSHPDYDRLIADAARTLDPVARIELFQQAEALLLEEAPIAPLYFDAQTYLIHPAVKNWHPSPLGFQRYQHVWLES